jgi:hypothetical protein
VALIGEEGGTRYATLPAFPPYRLRDERSEVEDYNA